MKEHCYGEDENKKKQVKAYNDKIAALESSIKKYQREFKVSREDAQKMSQKDSEDYGQPYGMNVDEWIATRKMQEMAAIDNNGNKIKEPDGSDRKYTKEQAIAANKIYKKVGFEGKKEEDIKKIIKTNYPDLDTELTFQAIRTYYKATQS